MRARAQRAYLRALSPPRLSRLTARLADLHLPGRVLRPLIRAYVRAYGVDMSEAAQPLESYPTFNAFFTRRLRAQARPIAEGPGVVVSPSDSRVSSIGPVPAGGALEQIKGRTYALDALLGSPEDAPRFARGVQATLYLSPAMYHRVHSPVEGRITSWRHLPGRLFPVNALAVRHVESLFAVNERVAVFFDTDDLGPVAVVLVGATNVGRISLAFASLVTNTGEAAGLVVPGEPIPMKRGEELGAFNLGSTVVILAANGALRPAGVESGGLVRMGEPLWRLP